MIRTTSLYRIQHPECFHFEKCQFPYFEGWYYKIEDSTGNHVLSIIPGVHQSANDGGPLPFVQGIIHGRSFFLSYPGKSFSHRPKPFRLGIGPNRFSLNRLQLALSGDGVDVNGALRLNGRTNLKTSFFSPGIMGPFSYLPMLECQHGILCLDARLTGNLRVQGNQIDFHDGRAYIEKDWGHSFPSAYLWTQSNRFSASGVSFVCAIASIPLGKISLTGFIAVLLIRGQQYRLAAYGGAHLLALEKIENGYFLKVGNRNQRLSVSITTAPGDILHAPVQGNLRRTVTESLQSVLHVKLEKRNSSVVFEDVGRNGGLEICGHIPNDLVGLRHHSS